MAVLVEGLVGLCDNEFVLHVGGHVTDFVCNSSCVLVDLAEGSLDEAVFIDSGVSGEVGDQTDVRAFRRLNRAHASVMAVVNVADFESGAVSRQTAGTEGGKSSLVGQLRKGIVLIHELREGRGAEEFLDRGINGTAVDQGGGRHLVDFVDAHLFPYALFEACKADSELVLEQFADRADSSVAEVVDVVQRADAVGHAVEVVDGRENIVACDVLGNQLIFALDNSFLYFVVGLAGVKNVLEHYHADLLVDAAFFLGVKTDIVGNIHHAVGDDLDLLLVFELDKGDAGAGIVDFLRLCLVDHFSCLSDDLAGEEVDDRLRHSVTHQTEAETQLLVVLVAADAGNVIFMSVEEHFFNVVAGCLHCGRFTGSELFEDLDAGVVGILNAVLGKGGFLGDGLLNALIVTEVFINIVVCGKTERTDEGSDGKLAVLVYSYIKYVVNVVLIFEPSASVGDNSGVEKLLAGLVVLHLVVHAGRTDQLRDNDAFRAVDNEGAAGSHERELSHVNLLLAHITGFSVGQACRHIESRGIGSVAELALFDCVLRLVIDAEINEFEQKIAGVIHNSRGILEDLPESAVKEPLIGILLHLDEIGHLQHFGDLGKGHSGISAVLNFCDIHHFLCFTPFTILRKKLKKIVLKAGRGKSLCNFTMRTFRFCKVDFC